MWPRRPHCISRASLFTLQGKFDARSSAYSLNLSRLMTNHHDQPVGVETLGGMNDTREQGLSCDPMKHFGLGRAHPLSQTGRKHDNAEVFHSSMKSLRR
jgi:hypothetical protein